MESLPMDITRLQRLQRLFLARDEAPIVKRAPVGMQRLPCYVRLEQHNLQPIRDHREQGDWLQRLSLFDAVYAHHGIANLNVIVGRLVGITSLDLSFNHISDIPESIAILVLLRNLCLRRNLLTCIPASVYLLTQLETLDLTENRIRLYHGIEEANESAKESTTKAHPTKRKT